MTSSRNKLGTRQEDMKTVLEECAVVSGTGNREIRGERQTARTGGGCKSKVDQPNKQ